MDYCYVCRQGGSKFDSLMPKILGTPIVGVKYCTKCGHEFWWECSSCGGAGYKDGGYCSACGRKEEDIKCTSCSGKGETRNTMPHNCKNDDFPFLKF